MHNKCVQYTISEQMSRPQCLNHEPFALSESLKIKLCLSIYMHVIILAQDRDFHSSLAILLQPAFDIQTPLEFSTTGKYEKYSGHIDTFKSAHVCVLDVHIIFCTLK